MALCKCPRQLWGLIMWGSAQIDAGGEVVITQLFYDVDRFFNFVKDCRSIGITAPIIPGGWFLPMPGDAGLCVLANEHSCHGRAGIMPIMTYGGFKRMTSFCKTAIPADVSAHLESIKDNDEAVKAYGVEQATQMCRRLLEAGTPGLHMYTLNLESAAVAILERLGLVNKSQVGACGSSGLPDAAASAGVGHADTCAKRRYRGRCRGGRRRRPSAARSKCGRFSGATGLGRT